MGDWIGLRPRIVAECPRCGCLECVVVKKPPKESGTWWGGQGKARCAACFAVFTITAAAGATAQTALPPVDTQSVPVVSTREEPHSVEKKSPLNCPKCGGRGLVRSTRKTVQYRKCKACGHNYQTEKKF